MSFIIKIFQTLTALALWLGSATSYAAPTSLENLGLSQLEKRVREIDHEISQLAQTSLRSGIGGIGYRSTLHKTSNNPEWIEISLGEEYVLDEIMLVPNIFRDSEKGFLSDGFPAKFRIIAGSSNDKAGTLIGEFNISNQNQGIAPHIFPANKIKASWLRVEAIELTSQAFNKNLQEQYVFQLAEVFVFSGERNVALHRPVTTSTKNPANNPSAWDKRFLVDGHTPYIMNGAKGRQSVAYLCRQNQSPTLSLDLLVEEKISRIQLHTLDQSDTVPQAYAGNLGIPQHLRIEGATKPDFSDAVTLLDTQPKSIQDIGPIMVWNIPETNCRYVRLIEVKPSSTYRVGFAEIELFAKDENVALNKKVKSSSPLLANRRLVALTDGLNLYGEILPIREWLSQLAHRQSLENQRPYLIAEIAQRYESQKNNIKRISWFAALLLIGAILLLWLQHIARQRAISKTRERIAANLHDELGANLHAIGLLGDFAKKIVVQKNAANEWPELNEVVDEIRTLTEETGKTALYCTNMLESKDIHANVVEEMTRTTQRMLSDIEHEASFPSENSLHQLKPRRRIDLYLFYKECLTNIIRHSGATYVTVDITVVDKIITLIVCDNGHGLEDERAPGSLTRRAKMLGGNLQTESFDPTGTKINLQINTAKRRLFKN